MGPEELSFSEEVEETAEVVIVEVMEDMTEHVVVLNFPLFFFPLSTLSHCMQSSIFTHIPGTTGISTGFPDLDEMLGGSGIRCGRLTEICGSPGLGKTQLW